MSTASLWDQVQAGQILPPASAPASASTSSPRGASSGNLWDQVEAGQIAGAPSSSYSQASAAPVKSSLGRKAALFGGGIAEGATGTVSGVGTLLENPSNQDQGEEDAAAVMHANGVPTLRPDLAGSVSSLPNWMNYIDPSQWPQLVHHGLVSLGMPTPATTGEQAAYNAGEGVGRVLPSAIAPETLPGALLSSEAGEAGRTLVQAAGGTPGEQAAADIGGSLLTSAPSALAGVTRLAVRGGESGRLAVQDSIDDFAASGTSPTIAQATRNRAVQGLERTVSNLPGGAGYMDQQANAQRAALTSTYDGIASNLSGGTEATPTAAGAALQAGAKDTVAKARADAATAYNQVDALVPPSTGIDLTNTSALLQRLTTPTPGAEATTGSLISPKLKALADNLQTDLQNNGGKLPYGAATALKSALGGQIDWSPFPTDPANGQLKQVYNTLRTDLNAGASSVSPEAAQAVKSANAQYAASQTQLDSLQGIVDRNGGPEAVFNAALNGTGPKGGATIVSQALEAMNPDQKNLFAAAVLRRMGNPSPGTAGSVFDPNQFLTNWNRMNPQAKSAIFDSLPNGYRQNLDAFASAIDRIKANSSVLANPSGTGRALAHNAWLTDLITSVPMAFVSPHVAIGQLALGGAVAGGSNILARVLTSPTAVKWLAQQTRAPAGRLLGTAAAASTTGASSRPVLKLPGAVSGTASRPQPLSALMLGKGNQ